MFDAKQAPNALHLSAIVHALPTAIVIVNETGSIVLVNAEAERLFGYKSEELLGEPIEVLIPSQFRSGHPALRGGFTAMPAARHMGVGRDLHGLHKSGDEFPVEIGLNPIKTEDGLFVVSAIVDITDRKRQEARFRATIWSLPTAMIMVDQVGTIVLANSELERLFGYLPDELSRKKIEVLIPKTYWSTHPDLRTQYFVSPSSRRMGEGRDLFGLRKNGDEFPIEIGLNPVRTDEGTFVLAAIVDLTERRRQSEALRRANEALEQSNIELQRFAFVASHDLQTPLRSMANIVTLLQAKYADKFDEEGNGWVQRIVSSAGRMQTMVRDLLNYSRIDTQPVQFKSVSFNEIADEVVAFLKPALEEVGGTIDCQANLPSVWGDRSQLTQLLLNLVTNAIKYRSSHRLEVSLRATVDGKQATFYVRDNGIGIAAKHQESIFEIFARLHSHSEIPGVGIGLSVVRRVVRNHGGSVKVYSEEGAGAEFSFTLPLP